jgi:hypothetical protein
MAFLFYHLKNKLDIRRNSFINSRIPVLPKFPGNKNNCRTESLAHFLVWHHHSWKQHVEVGGTTAARFNS